MTEKFITYGVGKDVYNIPESKVSEFEKDFPSATIKMHVDKDVYNIPIHKKDEFLKDFSNAVYAFDNSADNEEPKMESLAVEETAEVAPAVVEAPALPEANEEVPHFVEVLRDPYATKKEKRKAVRSARKEGEIPSMWETMAKGTASGAVGFAEGLFDRIMQGMSGFQYADPWTGKVYKAEDWYDAEMQNPDSAISKVSTTLGDAAEKLSREADPTGGHMGYKELMKGVNLRLLAHKGLAGTTESAIQTASAISWPLMFLNYLSNSGKAYKQQTLENPDIPQWKREAYSKLTSALEQVIERIEMPFGKAAGKAAGEALDGLTEEAAKKLLDKVSDETKKVMYQRFYDALKTGAKVVGKAGKSGLGESGEEVGTYFGNDAIGEVLDMLEGDEDYGIRAQWQQVLAENPDADLKDFLNKKADEASEAAIGGAISGTYMSGGAQAIKFAAKTIQGKNLESNMNRAYNTGSSAGPSEMYDVDALVNKAYDNAAAAFTDKDGNQSLSTEFIKTLSAEDAYRLSQKEDIPAEQQQALANLAIAKSMQEGQKKTFDDRLENDIKDKLSIIDKAAGVDKVISGINNGRPVYVQGKVEGVGDAVVKEDGSVVTWLGETGPIVVVDAITGEESIVNSSEIKYAESNGIDEYKSRIETMLRTNDAQNREMWRNTMSARAKQEDIQQYNGKKVLINVGDKQTEVDIQRIQPDGTVLVKGKKGDLGGQSVITMTAADFYDSIVRGEDGNALFAEDIAGRAEEAAEETAAPAANLNENPDYRGTEQTIRLNGRDVNAEVVSQDDTSDSVVFQYVDGEGRTRIGTSTVSDFGRYISEAGQQEVEPVEVEAGEEAVNEPIEVAVEEEQTETAPVEPEIEPQSINWDALFEQDKDAFFNELQNQYGERTERYIKAFISAAEGELAKLQKARPTDMSEIIANEDKIDALNAKIESLRQMIARLAEPVVEPEAVVEAEPEATVEVEPAAEEQTEAEEQPAEEQTEVVEETAEAIPVAPTPVDNPAKEAHKREKSLETQLKRYGIPREQKQDMAYNAGKAVGDFFATRDEYEAYTESAEAVDLGDFLEDFEMGVDASFANRQANAGNSVETSVTLEPESNTENNGGQTTAGGETTWNETETLEGHSDNSGSGRTDNGGNQAAGEGASQEAQGLDGDNRTEETVEEKYPARKGDVTNKQLRETFGFRAVNIYKQSTLNAIYDVFMEMAKMLGLSPKSMGHGGTLGFASVGSRVSENTDAQYGPGVDTINDRVKGVLYLRDRSLSGMLHEWWHSLDHMLNAWDDVWTRGWATSVGTTRFNGRKEVHAAILDILRAIKKSGHIARIDASNWYHKSYYKEKKEMTARAFEQYIMGKFAEKGIIIENVEIDNNKSQPTPEEMAVIAPAFDKFFEVIKEKEGKDPGTSVLFQIGQITETITEASKLAVDTVISALKSAGINVVKVTQNEVYQLLENNPNLTSLKDGDKIYGWTDGKTIYLTEAGMNPNTPVHEYTHIWARAMMQKNPKGWNSIKKLLKKTPVWNEVLNDSNYGNIKNDEDAVASEVLSRLSGTKNAAKLSQMAQQMIDDAKGTMRKAEARGLIQNVKYALNQFWSWVGKELFGIENFNSIDEITDRVLYDLMNQTDLGELSEWQVETQIAGEKGAYNLDTEEEFGEGVAYRMNALELAEQLESEGFDKKQIRTATGWERGYDGKWRYEIDDLVIKDNVKLKKGMTLGDIAEKNELFKAYPFLADIKVRKMTTKEFMETDADGAYIEDDNTIIVRVQNEDGIIGIDEWETLIHEVQHAIQHYEGFTAGASESFVRRNAREILRAEEKKAKPLYDRMEERSLQLADEMREEVYAKLPKRMSKQNKERALAEAVDKAKFRDEAFESIRKQWLPYAKRIQTLKILTGNPFYINRLEDPMVIWDLYKSYAGEVEARNAVNRMYLSPDERAEITFEETEDTPRERQVAIGESSYIEEARKKRMSNHYKAIPQDEYAVLADDLFREHKDKTVYGTIGYTSNYFYLCDYFGDRKDPKVIAIFEIEGDEDTRRRIEQLTRKRYGLSKGDIVRWIEDSWVGVSRKTRDTNGSKNEGTTSGDAVVASTEYREESEPRRGDESTSESGWISLKSGYDGSKFARIRFVDESEMNSLFDFTDDTDDFLFRSDSNPITPEMDADYIAAVERGDMETAQRMVLEAAKLAMPNTKVVDENGNPKVVYHGTGYEGNVFTSGFFASDEQFATDYGFAGNGFNTRVVNAFINMTNPRVVDADYANYDEIKVNGQTLSADDLVRETKKDGVHDGLIIKNVDERSTDGINWTDDIVPFAPSQIKSAETVTYDDNGNVIPLSERFNPEKKDIRYRKSDIQNAAVDFLAGPQRTELIQRAVNEEAQKLGVTVTYKTRSEMPKGHENDKGYYNTQTGEIVICTENNADINDAIQTILHEAVAHKGLRQLMGDRFNEFINRVYESLDAETKAKVDARAAAEYDGNTAVAMEEYLASLAETTDFNKNSVWDKVKSIFTDIINTILGRNDIKIGDNELRYILRASYNNMVNPRGMESITGWAKDQMMRDELGVNKAMPETLSRTGIDPSDVAKETAAQTYDKVVNSNWQEFQRQFQDAYQPVRIAIDAIQQETGNIPIEDYENYLLIQNQSSSRSRVEIDTFSRKYYSPIISQINAIIDRILELREVDKKNEEQRAEAYKEVREYLIAKHGLERNKYYQSTKTRPMTAAEMKPLIAEAQAIYDDTVAAINDDNSLSDAERELKLREANDVLNAAVTEIKTREVPDMRDYSGLTSLFGLDSKQWEQAEEMAKKLVDEFEKMLGRTNDESGNMIAQSKDIDALWMKINAATDKTLRHSYESGLLSSQQYNDIKKMFKFYIPLRGFDEDTAEDVYSYARFEGNRFNPAVKKAEGRTSVADDPIAIIMNMAESEIAQGNKNRAKQALYNYLLNRAGVNQQNSLMQVEDVWYMIGVDENGNKTYQVAVPNHDAGETYEEFEARMAAAAAEGLAEKSKKGNLDIGYRFQKQTNRNAHYVYLKVNGVEKAIFINGDPKAADAINGTIKQRQQYGEEKMRALNRFLSSTFTNYSLEFTARNYARDMIYSHINIAVRESDPAYRKKFRQNWRHNNLGTMLNMLKAYRAGEYDNRALTEDEAAFVEFMENGGQTGYTVINSVEAHKRDLEVAIERMRKGIEKGGVKDSTVFKYTLGAVELLNEASELVTRFAAFKTSRDMGRSVVRSISDAKEITVNFNTKGAQDGTGFLGGVARYFGWSKFFFNASVQGVQNIAAMAKANKLKFCGVVGGVMGLGFLNPILSAALIELFGGDDEDEYWNIPEYERQNNLCILLPFTHGAYVKIPLPIGFREMYSIGDMVAAMLMDKKFKRDVMQVGTDMANKIASVVLPINPLESSVNGLDIWQTIANTALPSSAQWIIQNMTNTDWKGAPIQKEYTYNEDDPQWMKAFANNPQWMTALSKWCNENINLDGDYKGLDWSPEKLDNTLSNLFGGPYSLIKKFGRGIASIMNDIEEKEPTADIIKNAIAGTPLVGVAIGSGADRDDRFVSDAYFDMKEYYDTNIGYIKRRAEKFGYDLDDVFGREKGKHHPKMQEIYSNKNFDFMQEWYKGSKELDDLNDEVKKVKLKIESKENPSEQLFDKLARKQEKLDAARREFVDDMLELD